ncbi:MAG TPA: hypothetical protein DD726_05810, partial [Phycisphaerales bacterium]|nr:hypothetical protein [Phycisphaerales bacterium]
KGINEQLTRQPVIQMGGDRKIDRVRIFKISSGGYRGIYNCKEQKITSANWNTTTWPLTDKNDTEVEVLNLGEDFATSVASTLLVGDYLMAVKVLDDSNKARWLGWSPRYAWWHL